MRHLFFADLLLKSGWQGPTWVSVDATGVVTAIGKTRPETAAEAHGALIPGIPNAHSHAFQYAMAGLAEHLPGGSGPAASDDFWSWRSAMYALALAISPEQMQRVAAMLYAEMLRQGTTQVVEFHYLHNDPAGARYADPAEMGRRLLAAAESAGIGLTLVPVHYRLAGFGEAAASEQRRFLSPTLDAYRALQAEIAKAGRERTDARVGLGVHSLRAAAPSEVKELFQGAFAGPAHLHVAEQEREVTDCVAATGRRPVRWLLDELGLDERFNLVHATHVDASEVRDLGRTRTTVVLCPSTEGNLGDGLFPLAAYRAAGGQFAIGSDSQVTLSWLEELRWLDYGQRLAAQRRNLLCTRGGDDSGRIAFATAWERGRLAAGLAATDYVAVGEPCDGIVLDGDHPVLAHKPKDRWLSTLIYAGDTSCFKAVLRRGRVVVENGRHLRQDDLRRDYATAVRDLLVRL